MPACPRQQAAWLKKAARLLAVALILTLLLLGPAVLGLKLLGESSLSTLQIVSNERHAPRLPIWHHAADACQASQPDRLPLLMLPLLT